MNQNQKNSYFKIGANVVITSALYFLYAEFTRSFMKKGVIDMMILTVLGYAMIFVLLVMVTVFISAKIESKITFKEIIDGFKRR